GFFEEPVGERHEVCERFIAEDELRTIRKSSRIADEIHRARKPRDALDVVEAEGARRQHLIRRSGVEHDLPLRMIIDIVCKGSASQSLQDPDLNFGGPQRKQTIEATGERVESFARQSRDQVRVDVNAGLIAKKAEVLLDLVDVEPSSNQFGG